MSFFARPDYKSDTTQFIEQLRAQKPDLEAKQLAGRAILFVIKQLIKNYRNLFFVLLSLKPAQQNFE